MKRVIGLSRVAVFLTAFVMVWSAGEQALGVIWGTPHDTNVYKGKVDGGGTIYFEAKTKKYEPVEMGYVLGISIPVDCTEETTRATVTHDSLPLDVRVHKRKFSLDSGDIQQLGETEKHPFVGVVSGTISHDNKTASGTVTIGPVDLNASEHGCTTGGVRSWTAPWTHKYAPHG
jgi:hypothetical protein